MKIAITGHRPNKLGNDYDLTSPLVERIEMEIMSLLDEIAMKEGKDPVLITGMALGIDTLFANIAIETGLNFIAAIPCHHQNKMWPNKSREKYRKILASPLCSIHQVCDREYDRNVMQERNEWMVDNCDILIAVWDGTSGGTSNCVNYCKTAHPDKTILYINPKDL